MNTLHDVLSELLAHPEQWPATSHAKIADAIRRLSRLLRIPLTDIPACPSSVTALVRAQLHWRTAGFTTEQAFGDWLGRIKRAIRETKCGRGGVPSFTRVQDYTPAWRALIQDLDDAVARGQAAPWLRRSLAHLAGFANSRGKSPAEVDNLLLKDLLDIHRQRGRAGKILTTKAIASARSWNRLIALKAGDNPEWLRHLPDGLTQLNWERQSRAVNPPIETWPPSLQADLTRLMGQLRGCSHPATGAVSQRFAAIVARDRQPARDEPDRRRWKRLREGLSEKTCRSYVMAIRQTVGALVRADTPLEHITALDQLLTPAATAISLEDYDIRLRATTTAIGEGPASAWQLATTLATLARHWRSPCAEELQVFAELRHAARTESCGTMAASRKKLLWQFDEPANLLAWFNRPMELELRAEAQRRRGRIADSAIADIETAILCRLVSVLPARLSNLGSIRIGGTDPHLVLSRHARESSWIIWPAREVKNKRWLRAEIDRESERLIRLYMAHYRPAYMQRHGIADSDALFAGGVNDGRGDAHRDYASLGSNFTKRMKEVGLDMTMHLARHLAARIVLDMDPTMLPLVADLLGDAIETVREYYVDGRTDRASAAYHQMLMAKAGTLHLQWKDIPHD